MDEAIGDVESSWLAEEETSSPNAVDARDIYVSQAYWAWMNAPADQKDAAWQTFSAVVASREKDNQLFQTIASKACADVNKLNCQESLLSDQGDLEDMDCHYALVHTFHASCPASESHHSTGGWNGYNMKFSQVLANLCNNQAMLGKKTEELESLVRDSCGASALVV